MLYTLEAGPVQIYKFANLGCATISQVQKNTDRTKTRANMRQCVLLHYQEVLTHIFEKFVFLTKSGVELNVPCFADIVRWLPQLSANRYTP